jgi:hypothetical protein
MAAWEVSGKSMAITGRGKTIHTVNPRVLRKAVGENQPENPGQ